MSSLSENIADTIPTAHTDIVSDFNTKRLRLHLTYEAHSTYVLKKLIIFYIHALHTICEFRTKNGKGQEVNYTTQKQHVDFTV